jgi:hypothetical protein
VSKNVLSLADEVIESRLLCCTAYVAVWPKADIPIAAMNVRY